VSGIQDHSGSGPRDGLNRYHGLEREPASARRDRRQEARVVGSTEMQIARKSDWAVVTWNVPSLCHPLYWSRRCRWGPLVPAMLMVTTLSEMTTELSTSLNRWSAPGGLKCNTTRYEKTHSGTRW
jgi:hypothetical protein